MTPTHRLAKEMRARGVKSQTYHSFFWYCGTRRARFLEEDLAALQVREAQRLLPKASTPVAASEDRSIPLFKAPLRVISMDEEEVLWEDEGSDIFHRYNKQTDEGKLTTDPVVFRAKKEGGAEVHPQGDHLGQNLHRAQADPPDVPGVARLERGPGCLLR